VQVERGAIRAGEGCCPHCGHNERLIDVGRRTGRPTFRLFAVESIPADHRRRVLISDRKFARADAADMARFDSAAALLHQFRSNVPRREIPRAGRVDTRLLDYGYHCYAELFNDRQLLHLAKLVGAVRDLAPEFREPMALALSNHTTSSNMMTSYTSNWRQATPLFAIRAFRHSPRPVELNPWLAGVGRGTFPNAVRKVEGARRYSQNPTELASSGSRVVPRVPHGDVLVLNQDSGSLKSVPDASIDLVVTDPPYFDYIAYSELSDWFVPWLAGTGLIPRRAASASPQTLASPGRGSIDAEQFSRKLTTVMCELRRVLRPGGRLVFTFQHRSPRAWLALASALHAAGFEAVNVFPLKGDGDEGLHHHNGSSTWDAVLVCRPSHPSTSQPTLAGPRHVEVLRDHAAGWIKRLDLGSSDAAVISFASLVAGALGFGRTRERRRLDLAAVLATVERPQTPAAADVAQHDLLDGTRT
jgi:adenine-specific DNA methylase